MINIIWLILIVSGIIVATINGRMEEVSTAIFQSTTESVQICFNLIGPMALWLGLMNIAKKSGLIEKLSQKIYPIFKYLFPEAMPENEVTGTIMLNISANILGLGNAATPLGIKAMQQLQKSNQEKERASPAMCTLLALNTSSLTIIPATIISLRVAAGSLNPTIIVISTVFATGISTITAIIFDKFFRQIY